MKELLFVSATRGAKEHTPLWASLQALGVNSFHFFEHNQRGLPVCYNECLDRLAGSAQILVLAHSDITLADVFVREKVNHALTAYDIAGVVGSAWFDIHRQADNYAWQVWPAEYLSGAVEMGVGRESTTWCVFGSVPRRCVLLDGMFLAIDLQAIGNVRFDPRFAFHLYDIDFCVTAHLAQLKLGTTNVYLQHLSAGDYTSEAYRRSMRDFRAKWEPIFAQSGSAGA
jgi:hypothetical protein